MADPANDAGTHPAQGAATLPIPPLYLPVGSVRALITLSILATVWLLVLGGRAVPDVLRITLVLVLGYYFGARGGATRADAVAGTTGERQPLYLPRGMIRALIVVGFGAVAWKLHQEGRLLGADGPPPILVLVATFVLGAFAKGTAAWLRERLWRRSTGLFGHALAAATLLVVLGYCGALAAGREALLPARATEVFLGVVGFYLGKR